jgi:hypothetical protein
MAEWQIQTPTMKTKKETADRARLGDTEYFDRVRVAEERASELSWQEEQVYGHHFEDIAVNASDKIWPMLKTKPGKFWAKLLAKMAE